MLCNIERMRFDCEMIVDIILFGLRLSLVLIVIIVVLSNTTVHIASMTQPVLYINRTKEKRPRGWSKTKRIEAREANSVFKLLLFCKSQIPSLPHPHPPKKEKKDHGWLQTMPAISLYCLLERNEARMKMEPGWELV